MALYNYNGKLYREDEPVITATSRGLRYGDGVFETMKWQQDKLILADEHFARLWKGMHTLQFEIPKHFTPDKIAAEIKALVKKNQHEKAARIRLTIVRGSGGLYDIINHQPNYIIETWPLPEDNSVLNSNGLVMGIYPHTKKSCDELANIKHNNYLPGVMAALHAKKQKWNDAVLLNTQGRICESTIANIFIVKDNAVFTPALQEGCVAGIMRRQVIVFLKQHAIDITETEITVAGLLSADEVFLTNAVYNIKWVQRIENKEYTSLLTQKIFTGIFSTIC